MEITEVRIKLVTNPSERLRAFCSVTLNGDFVIRDLKIIEGVNGAFVAMPSRKLADRCPRCGCKNHLRARFCNECGTHLKENRAPKDNQGRAKLHADIAHPINAGCRERIQKAVVDAYAAEQERSKSPDYKPQSFDDFDDFDMELSEMAAAPVPAQADDRQQADTAPAVKEQAFSDYNSLIADLKRDAAGRRQTTPEEADAPKSLRLPPSDGQNAIGKPAYIHNKRAAESTDTASPAHRSVEPANNPAAAKDSDDAGFGAGLA